MLVTGGRVEGNNAIPRGLQVKMSIFLFNLFFMYYEIILFHKKTFQKKLIYSIRAIPLFVVKTGASQKSSHDLVVVITFRLFRLQISIKLRNVKAFNEYYLLSLINTV